jgi:hypothetical protein
MITKAKTILFAFALCVLILMSFFYRILFVIFLYLLCAQQKNKIEKIRKVGILALLTPAVLV